MKKVLVIRYGAYGDMLLITPALKKLKELGYHVIVDTTERGREVLQNNPNVDELSDRVTDQTHIRDLDIEWKRLDALYKPDLTINFTESLEVAIALHPRSPMYIYPKKERIPRCNVNYYDFMEKWAKLGPLQKQGELFFTEEELAKAKSYLKPEKFNILWCLSGSGKNKVYPWSDYVMGEILKNHKNINIITIGDERCQLLESLEDKDITNLSGKIPMRISMAMTQFCDLVISPDTGILHAAGCYTVPKIGLLGHSTKENITKYFKNDYSIESKCECAPCFRLIYDHTIQCPQDEVTRACWCMAHIKPEDIYERFQEVHDKWTMSVLQEEQKDLSGIKVR